MFDWMLVYAVVFLFVILFQYMVHFFDPKEKGEEKKQSKETPNSVEEL